MLQLAHFNHMYSAVTLVIIFNFYPTLEELSEQQSESNMMTGDLMRFIQLQVALVNSTVVAGGISSHLQPHDVLKHITKTRKLLSEYCDEIKLQCNQKELILSSNNSTDD